MHDRDPLMNKVEMIMESPNERNKYKELNTFEEKLAFIRNHFILKDLEIRLLERKYLLSPSKTDELLSFVDDLIRGYDLSN